MNSPHVLSKLLFVGLGLLLICAPGDEAWAQDAQYWTDQYGNRARLLAGAVIGSSTDLASVYYNPGALALVKNPELLLSANVFQYTHYTLQLEDSEMTDLSSSLVGGAPSLFAGEIKFGFLGKMRFGYSVLTRFKSNIRLESVAVVPEPSAQPELEFRSSGFDGEQKLTETWVGFTLSQPVGQRWGIGISPYLTIRSQRISSEMMVQAVDTTGLAGSFLEGRDVRFDNWRILLKIGASAVYGAWRFGATVTTPSLRLFGSGDTYITRSLVVQEGPGSVMAYIQEDVAADYVAPLAIGAGVGYERGSSALNVAVEYFSRIDERDVLAIEPVQDPNTGEPIDVNLSQEFDPVLNIAIGWQQRFRETLEGYAGFRTDFSAKPADSENLFPLSSWNIYHLSGGATFAMGRSHFTLGAVVAWGQSDEERITGGEGEDGEAPQFDIATRMKYFRTTLIFGFSIFFD
jgi:hypothetical protein